MAATDLTGNDADPDRQALAVAAVEDSANDGTVTGSAATGFTYTPKPGFTGTDAFTYLVTDPDGHLAQGTATIQVEPTGSTNTAPVTGPDVARTNPGTYVYVYPLGNDHDPDGDSFGIYSVATPAHGTVSYSVGGSYFIYTPDAGFTGLETITYTIRDSTRFFFSRPAPKRSIATVKSSSVTASPLAARRARCRCTGRRRRRWARARS